MISILFALSLLGSSGPAMPSGDAIDEAVVRSAVANRKLLLCVADPRHLRISMPGANPGDAKPSPRLLARLRVHYAGALPAAECNGHFDGPRLSHLAAFGHPAVLVRLVSRRVDGPNRAEARAATCNSSFSCEVSLYRLELEGGRWTVVSHQIESIGMS
jgi:hypothetical protein